MKPALVAVAWAVGLLIAAGGTSAQTTLWLKPPTGPEVSWRGMQPTEGEGVGMGPQIGPYIVPGPAGLLAAIFTHAAISQGVQSAQRQREQEEADRVLVPYQPALRAWSSQDLWSAAAAASGPGVSLKPWDAGQADPEHGVLDVAPVFTLAQDEGVLIADVAVKRVASATLPAMEAVVRVVSSPHDAADARAHWSADDARRLKDTAARMLAHAIELAHQHGGPSASDTPARTHRYLQGRIERSERAQQLGGDCARAVLRTLRGWLMSVPLPARADTPCTPASPL